MPMLRGNALRSFQSTLRYSSARATARVAAPARTQLVAKRFASSGGHGDHGASSDLPWMLGALVVTPPTCWYLWPAPHDDDHHGDHGHEEEHAEGGEEEEKPSEEDQSSEDEAPQVESAPGEQADKPQERSGDDSKDEGEDKSSDDEGEDHSQPEGTEQNEGKSNTGGKGKVAEGSAASLDERKSEPRPSKGTNVKRIDSGLGKNLGEGETHDEDGKESQATSKPASSHPGDMSAKQKGLSTTDTKHSEQIDQDSEKSKKGTGEPETAKAKGTVDPKAPVR